MHTTPDDPVIITGAQIIILPFQIEQSMTVVLVRPDSLPTVIMPRRQTQEAQPPSTTCSCRLLTRESFPGNGDAIRVVVVVCLRDGGNSRPQDAPSPRCHNSIRKRTVTHAIYLMAAGGRTRQKACVLLWLPRIRLPSARVVVVYGKQPWLARHYWLQTVRDSLSLCITHERIAAHTPR